MRRMTNGPPWWFTMQPEEVAATILPLFSYSQLSPYTDEGFAIEHIVAWCRTGRFAETCDQVLCIGTILTDFNTGAFTARLDEPRTITVGLHRTAPLRARSLGDVVGDGDDPITAEALYPRWERFFRPDDTIITEIGTSSMGLGFAHLPSGATFHNQMLWGSIGWATPAAFGAAVAHPHGRVILVTGDGSHQLTVQEISQFARRGLRPIIFVLNNNGYLIERLLCKDPNIPYNDIASWNYAEIPHALGCEDWYTARATTCGELDNATSVAAQADTGVYIEVVTDTYAASKLAMQIHDNVATLYST